MLKTFHWSSYIDGSRQVIILLVTGDWENTWRKIEIADSSYSFSTLGGDTGIVLVAIGHSRTSQLQRGAEIADSCTVSAHTRLCIFVSTNYLPGWSAQELSTETARPEVCLGGFTRLKSSQEYSERSCCLQECCLSKYEKHGHNTLRERDHGSSATNNSTG